MITRGLLDIAWPSLPRNATGIGKKEITAIYATLPVKTADIWHQVAGEEAASPGRATPHPQLEPGAKRRDRAAVLAAESGIR